MTKHFLRLAGAASSLAGALLWTGCSQTEQNSVLSSEHAEKTDPQKDGAQTPDPAAPNSEDGR